MPKPFKDSTLTLSGAARCALSAALSGDVKEYFPEYRSREPLKWPETLIKNVGKTLEDFLPLHLLLLNFTDPKKMRSLMKKKEKTISNKNELDEAMDKAIKELQEKKQLGKKELIEELNKAVIETTKRNLPPKLFENLTIPDINLTAALLVMMNLGKVEKDVLDITDIEDLFLSFISEKKQNPNEYAALTFAFSCLTEMSSKIRDSFSFSEILKSTIDEEISKRQNLTCEGYPDLLIVDAYRPFACDISFSSETDANNEGPIRKLAAQLLMTIELPQETFDQAKFVEKKPSGVATMVESKSPSTKEREM
jgi:hypothetical protein